jgi:uncharacterized protein (DUF885 family)
MDRRQFIVGSTVLAGASLMPAAALAQAAAQGSSNPTLNALFEQIFQTAVSNSPELASSLGLDRGANAALKGRLSPRTAAERRSDTARTRAALAELGRFDQASLSAADKLNLDVVKYQLETQIAATTRFNIDSAIRPYRIFQQGGAYFSVPDFLNTAHTIRTTEDADAYLARLEAFATILDQEIVMQRAEAARGFVAPAWSIDLTLGQMRRLREAPAAQSTMVSSLVRRATAANLAGNWQSRATAIVSSRIYPAIDRQIAMMTQLRRTTRAGDGAWRLPQGAGIYAMALQQATTTTLSPAEVHRMGLAQVAEISARIDEILKREGLTQGTVGERLAILNVRADQVYPNTDEGRAALIASLNQGVEAMNALLPRAFATLPTQPLEIRRVPVEIQDGASNGYYNRAALDGSRPAIYFINLKDTGDWPKYSLPALTYHEGTPGHHLQISIAQQSGDIPTLRKVGGFSAYSEGWALYAEEVANTLGGYATPLEQAGYLQSFLFRAARLVVDTGIHDQRWTRERATDYLVATTGFARPRSQREVERYCTQMGQACSYKIGHGVWTRLRAEAEAAGGANFDQKQFHEVLREGAMPLTILEARVRERMRRG